MTPTPTTFNDKSIIELAFEQALSPNQLHQINLVWIYLQLLFISDLTRPNSNRVLDYFLEGEIDY